MAIASTPSSCYRPCYRPCYHYRRQRQQRTSSSSAVRCYVVMFVVVVVIEVISTPRHCCVVAAWIPSSKQLRVIHHCQNHCPISTSLLFSSSSSGRRKVKISSRLVSKRRRRHDKAEEEGSRSCDNNRIVEIGVGVDLGTTNSAVAILINRRPVMIRIHDDNECNEHSNSNSECDEAERSRRRNRQQQQAGATTIPSVVAFEYKSLTEEQENVERKVKYNNIEIRHNDEDDDKSSQSEEWTKVGFDSIVLNYHESR